jgi:hypothetical protein
MLKIIIMLTLNRKLLLDTLIKHETLTLTDIGKEKNLGLTPNKHHLQLLLDELEQDSYIQKLNGAVPCTYTVTDKGITEGNRLKAV